MHPVLPLLSAPFHPKLQLFRHFPVKLNHALDYSSAGIVVLNGQRHH